MGRLTNYLYTYTDLKKGVDNFKFLPVYAFTENTNVAVNKTQTLSRVKVIASNLPDNKMPTWDDLVPLYETVNISWTNTAAATMSSQLKFTVNGTLISTVTGSTGTFTEAKNGDTVIITQSSPVTWTSSGTATLSRTLNSDFQQVSDSTYSTEPNSLTFVVPVGTVSVAAKTEANGDLATGLLVLDLNNVQGTFMDVIAYIDNVEAGINYQQLAYSGNNFVPIGVEDTVDPSTGLSYSPPRYPNSMILASDLVTPMSSALDYRFIFNIGKILNTHQNITVLKLMVRGRSTVASSGQGAYGEKGGDTTPVMNNSTGTYIPGVTFDNSLGGFSLNGLNIAAGADGSKTITDLPLLLKFEYTVATKNLVTTQY